MMMPTADLQWLVEAGIMPFSADELRSMARGFRSLGDWCEGLAEQIEPSDPADAFTWAVCAGCGGNIFRHHAWSHEGGTPPQDHAAEPVDEAA